MHDSTESIHKDDPNNILKSWHMQQEKALNDIKTLNKNNIMKTNDAIAKINTFIQNITHSGIYIETSTDHFDQTAKKSIREFTGEES
jgi:hypothetical protein